MSSGIRQLTGKEAYELENRTCNIGLPGLPSLAERAKEAAQRDTAKAAEEEVGKKERRKAKKGAKQTRRAKKSAKHHNIRSFYRTLGQEINRKGLVREGHVVALVKELVDARELLSFFRVPKWSPLDHQGVDIAIQRLDSTSVPIEVKSSRAGKENFIAEAGDICIEQYGEIPVIVISYAGGFHDPERRKWALLREIKRWSGHFDFDPWLAEPINYHSHEEQKGKGKGT